MIDAVPTVFSLDQLDAYGLTPFLLAVLTGHSGVVRILLQFKLPVQTLSSSPENSSLTMGEFVVDLDESGTSDSGYSVEDGNIRMRLEATFKDSFPEPPRNVPKSFARNWVAFDSLQPISVCPIDLNRQIRACWYPGSKDKNGSGRHSRMIINPICCSLSEDHAVCGQFNALHLSVMSG